MSNPSLIGELEDGQIKQFALRILDLFTGVDNRRYAVVSAPPGFKLEDIAWLAAGEAAFKVFKWEMNGDVTRSQIEAFPQALRKRAFPGKQLILFTQAESLKRKAAKRLKDVVKDIADSNTVALVCTNQYQDVHPALRDPLADHHIELI